MHKRFAQIPVYITLVIIVAAALLAGCGSTATGSTPASTPAGSSQPAQDQQGSQQSGQQGGQQGGGKGGPGGQDFQAMQTKLLARVAEILGVSTESLTTAYQSAIKEVMGNMTPPSGAGQGQPPSVGTQGQPPSSGGTPPMPPSDNRTGGPGGRGGPDMSGVYSKVASALGLTAEKVQAAFEQARTELMPERMGK